MNLLGGSGPRAPDGRTSRGSLFRGRSERLVHPTTIIILISNILVNDHKSLCINHLNTLYFSHLGGTAKTATSSFPWAFWGQDDNPGGLAILPFMPISSQLRQAVNQSGLSLNQIATATKVPTSILSRFLSGGPNAGRDIRLETTADKLAEFFGLELTRSSGEPKAAALTRKPKPKSGRPRGGKK
jgi:hypothetical protein